MDLIDVWKCPYCNNIYDNEDDAENCLDECHSDSKLELKDVEAYRCSMCGRYSKKRSHMTACERRHINNKDMYFRDFEHKEQLKELAKIASHPSQKKLDELKCVKD